MVVQYDFPPDAMTLSDVERFRTYFANMYGLEEWSMFFQDVNITESVNVFWLVPVSIIAYIQKQILASRDDFFQAHHIVNVTLEGDCVYQSRTPSKVHIYIVMLVRKLM